MDTAQTGTLRRIVSTRMPTKWGMFDAIGIERDLGITRVRLLSNNPREARALFDAGVEVVARIPCEAPPNPHSFAYLRAEKEKLGQTLTLHRECPA